MAHTCVVFTFSIEKVVGCFTGGRYNKGRQLDPSSHGSLIFNILGLRVFWGVFSALESNWTIK
jgi:hypothetical protein